MKSMGELFMKQQQKQKQKSKNKDLVKEKKKYSSIRILFLVRIGNYYYCYDDDNNIFSSNRFDSII